MINYYKLPEQELSTKIKKIIFWLLDYPKDSRHNKAILALRIAINADEIERTKLVKEVIQYLT